MSSKYPLHKAVFDNQPETLKSLIVGHVPSDDTLSSGSSRGNPADTSSLSIMSLSFVDEQDGFGNTPLHLAIMLNRIACADVLIDARASVSVKNKNSWTPLEEAISLGNRDLLRKLVQLHLLHLKERSKKRTPMLLSQIKQFGDFFLQIKWDFHSWIPLASRLLPNDMCNIYKRGACIRLDSTLVDFSDMKWQRGNISYIFQPSENGEESAIVLNHDEETVQRVSSESNPDSVEDDLDMLMSTDIGTMSMPTKHIEFTRAKAGIWGWRHDRTDTVGAYQARVYNVSGLNLIMKKRREHLSEEDLQQNRQLLKQLRGSTGNDSTERLDGSEEDLRAKAKQESDAASGGDSDSNKDSSNDQASSEDRSEPAAPGDEDAYAHRESLPPPPACTVTWDDYTAAFASGDMPELGRPIVMKNTVKSFKPTIWMCDDYPLTVDQVLKLLEILAPAQKHLSKLKQFVASKLPSGFPVKVELPVFPTITAQVTFLEYRGGEQDESLFAVPAHYQEKKSPEAASHLVRDD